MSEIENIPVWTWFYGEDLMKREAVIEFGGDFVNLLADDSRVWKNCSCPKVVIPQGETLAGLHLLLFTGFLPQYGAAADVQRFDLSKYWSDQAESGRVKIYSGEFPTVLVCEASIGNVPYAIRGDLGFSPQIGPNPFRGFWSDRQCIFQKVFLYALGIPSQGARVTILTYNKRLNPEYRTIRSAPEGLFMER